MEFSCETQAVPSTSQGSLLCCNNKRKCSDENEGQQCKIFKRRSGVRNQGNSYEDVVTANLTLKLLTSDKIEKFYISTNDNNFEHFDDVVIDTISSSGVKATIAIQLKQFESNEEIEPDSLGFGTKNNRKISKGLKKLNFKEYVNLTDNEQSCDRLILFTNKKFSPDLQKTYILEFDKYYPKISFEVKIERVDNTEDLLNNGYIYKFKIVSDIQKNESPTKLSIFKKFDLFFSKFFLYTNQPGVSDMEILFTENITTTFDCEATPADKYLKFINHWNNLKKTNTLCKQFISKFLTQLLLQIQTPSSVSVLNEKAKVLQEGISEFDVTLFKDSDIKGIWNDNNVANCEKNKNDEEQTCIHMDQNNIGDLEESKKLWLTNKRPLIVVDNAVFRKVMSILTPKNIVVTKKSQTLDSSYPVHFSVFRCLADLRSKPDIYNKILENFEISFQGRKPVNLKSLVDIDKKFEEIITPDELMKMTDRPLLVGGEKEELPTIYIERQISTRTVERNFLETCDKETFVIISHLNNFPEFRNVYTNFHFIELDTFLQHGSQEKSDSKKNIYVTEGKCSRENIEKIFDGKETNATYLFRLRKDGLLEYVRHSKDDGYLDFFIQEQYNLETDVYNGEFDDNIELIGASPGMGKSTLTKNLKNNLNPKYFAIVIQATDIPMYFRQINRQNLADSFVEIFSKNTFDKSVLDIFKDNHSIMFVWDAVDELSNRSLDQVITVIDELSQEGFPQWVTSRDHIIPYLEQNFITFAKTIEPFNEEQQEIYIKKRLQEKYPNNIDNIVEAIKTNIRLFRYEEILAVPLQIYMLTSIFYEDPNKYVDLLNSTFSIIHLYQYFLDEKFQIYSRDKLQATSDRLLDELDERRNDYEKQYGICAIKFLFEYEIENVEDFITKTKSKGDFPGLISRITNDDVVVFIHPSFGEFFAALYFYRNPDRISDFRKIIFIPRYNNVRFMFDLLMAEDNPLHLAVLHQKMPNLQSDNVKIKDKGGRTPLHLICSWGNRYVPLQRYFVDINERRSFKEKYVDGYYSKYYDDNDDEFYKKSVQRESESYEQIILHLLQSISYSQCDTLYKMDAVDYANSTLSLFAVIITSKKESLKARFTNLSTLLFYAIKFDHSHILNLLNDIPLVKTRIAGNSLLHLAVKYSAESCVRRLLENEDHRDTIDLPNNQKFLPIHAACKNGNVNIVKMLTDGDGKIANVNAKTHKDNTPLHIACCNKHGEVVELLIELGGDVNFRNKNGETPTHVAANEGYSEIIGTLLYKFPGPLRQIDWEDNNGDRPLHYASQKGHNDTVSFLVDVGADINCRGYYGKRPIHYACEKGHTETAKLLEQLGADLNSRDEGGKTPLHYAALEGWFPLTLFLLEKRGDLVNSPDRNGDVPLHYASHEGHEKVIDLLVERGAIVNFHNNAGNTPLHRASYEGTNKYNYKIVKKLCDLGAEINCRNNRLQTPLHLTCPWGKDLAANMLIKLGAAIDSQDSDGKTPLHQATESCWDACEEIILLLVDNGASINAQDKYGQTPLHHASMAGNDEKNENIVNLLIDLGADINIQDKDGETPLSRAMQWRHDNIINLLDR